MVNNMTESMPGKVFIQCIYPRGEPGNLIIPAAEISMVLSQEQRFSEKQVESAVKDVDRISPDKERETLIVQYCNIKEVPEKQDGFAVVDGNRAGVHCSQKVVCLQSLHCGCGEPALREDHHPLERQAGYLLMGMHPSQCLPGLTA